MRFSIRNTHLHLSSIVGLLLRQVEFWRQVKPMPVLALRCAQLEGLEGIIVMFDLSEVRGEILEFPAPLMVPVLTFVINHGNFSNL